LVWSYVRSAQTGMGNPPEKGTPSDNAPHGIGFELHSLRHTAVSLLKDAGVPEPPVMALVGAILTSAKTLSPALPPRFPKSEIGSD
jgi:hypothetical protein